MFENIETLKVETNLSGITTIKGMISTEHEYLPFKNEGLCIWMGHAAAAMQFFLYFFFFKHYFL